MGQADERQTSSFLFDAHHGGRLAQLRIGKFELLFSPPEKDRVPTSWGAYPMVPWAGRIADGRFSFGGRNSVMPINFDDHAIHGTAFTSAWTQLAENHLVLDLDQPWPFSGTVSHRVHLTDNGETGSVVLELSVLAAASAMPVMVGWHPWFNRRLTATGAEAQLTWANFETTEMYELDDRMIPTGGLVSPPPPGPWDHPFRNVGQPLTIDWEGQLKLQLRSSCDHWVVFDQREYAFCVEPQSGPPDIFNSERFDRDPDVIGPGEQFTRTFTIDWALQ